jgi:hypothetical protein
MKRLLAVVLGIAISIAAASPVGAKTPKPPKNVVVLTNDQIAGSALLTLADMPTGYAAVPDTNTQPNGTSGFCNGPNEPARAQAQGVVGSGSSEFGQNPSFGPFLGASVYSFPSTKQAAAVLDAERAQSTCGMFNSANGTVTLTEAISQIAFTKVGDDTVALRLTSSTQGGTGPSGSSDQITVRIANNVISVVEGGLGGPSATLDQQYVSKSISKLGVAIEVAKQAAKKTKKKGKS